MRKPFFSSLWPRGGGRENGRTCLGGIKNLRFASKYVPISLFLPPGGCFSYVKIAILALAQGGLGGGLEPRLLLHPVRSSVTAVCPSVRLPEVSKVG